MSRSFDLKTPDLFTVGTVGPPGQRAFYLQARETGLLVTLKVEKEQVAALAEYLEALLAKLSPAAAVDPGDLALLEPLAPAWAVRSLGVGYDNALDRVVVVAEELTEEEPEEGEEGEASESGAEGSPEAASARFLVSLPQTAAFVERARELLKAGRKPCQICGQPMDPGGHVCPRQNGHGRG